MNKSKIEVDDGVYKLKCHYGYIYLVRVIHGDSCQCIYLGRYIEDEDDYQYDYRSFFSENSGTFQLASDSDLEWFNRCQANEGIVYDRECNNELILPLIF